MPSIRYKILIIARGYPGRVHPLKGLFVQQQAQAQAAQDDVAVLHVISDPDLHDRTYQIEQTNEAGVLTVRVYYRKSDIRLRLTSPLIKLGRYLQAAHLGYASVQSRFGLPDLVHVHMALPGGFLALALKLRRRIPFIITEHLTDYMAADGSYARASWIYQAATRLIFAQARASAAVSHALLGALEHHKLQVEIRRVIPNVVAIGADTVADRSGGAELRILTTCLLDDRQKNISGLLRAFSRLLQRYPQAVLSIAGDGPDRPHLQRLAAGLGLSAENLIFLGFVAPQDLRLRLAKTHFFVLNSNFETFSVATAEALVQGVPVVVTACGGPEEFVDEQCGLVVPVGDEEALLQAMKQMAENYGRYRPEVLKNKVHQLFAPETVCRHYHQLYETCLQDWPVGFGRRRLAIPPGWRVLDVGSGHNPNRRANVLLERELDASMHRSGEKAARPGDKDLVVGDAVAMPFVSQTFDYAVASHIAEHIENISAFLAELQRVAKRGYIETPGPLSEFLLPEPYHVWILRTKKGTLQFKRKKRVKPFAPLFYELFYLNEERFGHPGRMSSNRLLKGSKRALVKIWKWIPGAYTRYDWVGSIRYKILDL